MARVGCEASVISLYLWMDEREGSMEGGDGEEIDQGEGRVTRGRDGKREGETGTEGEGNTSGHTTIT